MLTGSPFLKSLVCLRHFSKTIPNLDKVKSRVETINLIQRCHIRQKPVFIGQFELT